MAIPLQGLQKVPAVCINMSDDVSLTDVYSTTATTTQNACSVDDTPLSEHDVCLLHDYMEREFLQSAMLVEAPRLGVANFFV